MSKNPRNSWLIPAGSFLLALSLAFLLGTPRRALARIAAASSELCHQATAKDGQNDDVGKADNVNFNTPGAASAAEFGYANSIVRKTRKPSGEARLFAGNKNGAKGGPAQGPLINSSARGWELIHGQTGENCCHTLALDTKILIEIKGTVTKPVVVGTNRFHGIAMVDMEEMADNCDAKRPLKANPRRMVTLAGSRFLLRNGGDSFDHGRSYDSATHSASPAFFDGNNSIEKKATFEAKEDPWYFKKLANMIWTGKAFIEDVLSTPGQGQVTEGYTHVFKSASEYSITDSGSVNKCSN